MKKSIIVTMITITLIFCSFVCGFYVGKNQTTGSVEIRGLDAVNTTVGTNAPMTKPSAPSNTSADNTTSTTATEPVPTVSTAPGLININTATLEQLDSLPGIGPVIAQAIIDYRSEYGDFEIPEDLLHVPGIGEKKLNAILDLITTGG